MIAVNPGPTILLALFATKKLADLVVTYLLR
jgi:hypothetical protein